MAKLKKLGNVDTQADTHFTVVTVCSWATYQRRDNDEGHRRGQAKDRQRTGKGQAKDTYKKGKKGETGEKGKKTASADKPPRPASAPLCPGNPDANAEVVDAWNAMAERDSHFTKVRTLSRQRKAHLAARWQEALWRDNWAKMIESIPTSDFLAGKGDKHWIVSFDWLIRNDENYAKIIEGKYTNRQNGAAKPPPFEQTPPQKQLEVALERGALAEAKSIAQYYHLDDYLATLGNQHDRT